MHYNTEAVNIVRVKLLAIIDREHCDCETFELQFYVSLQLLSLLINIEAFFVCFRQDYPHRALPRLHQCKFVIWKMTKRQDTIGYLCFKFKRFT